MSYITIAVSVKNNSSVTFCPYAAALNNNNIHCLQWHLCTDTVIIDHSKQIFMQYNLLKKKKKKEKKKILFSLYI